MSFQPDHTRPVNPLPLVVVALAVIVAAVELFFLAAENGLIGGGDGIGYRITAMENYAFYEPLFQWMVENGTMKAKYMLRLVTYPFLQGSFTQAVFVIVFLLALGKMVAERMGQWPVLAVFFGASIVGAVVYGFVWDTRVPLFGGYPGAYGLVGAFSLILWARLGESGGPRYQAFALIAALLSVQLIFGIFVGTGKNWVAEVAGFVAGFGIAFVAYPGAWSKIVTRARKRA